MPDVSTAGFLAAFQLFDSFFPAGMYAHSHGLEGMVRRGRVRTAADVEEFIGNQLAWSIVSADGVALLHAHRAAMAEDLGTVIAIDRLLFALKLPTELRAASCQMGRRVLTEIASLVSHPIHAAYRTAVSGGETPGTGAVALGVSAAALGIPAAVALLGFCHSYVVGMLGAAMRLLPLTHSQVQSILHRLHPAIAELVQEVEVRPWQEMTAFAPELDLAAMGHEADDLRMFAS